MMMERRAISISEIQETVAAAFHVSRADLLSRNRRQHVAYARHIAMYLTREMGGRSGDEAAGNEARARASFPRIAIAFGRNHSSVIYACGAIERRRRLDLAFARLLDRIAGKLLGHPGDKSEIQSPENL